MALKAVHLSDIPILHHVVVRNTLFCAQAQGGVDVGIGRVSLKAPKFLVIGHRGNGMNLLQSSDTRMTSFKENSILSFNAAGKFDVDFIEFDVQVTKDHCPVIFHDDYILSQENGTIFERRVTELLLSEFLGIGPQKDQGKLGKSLMRKNKQGNVYDWKVETDDSLCTLQDAFQKVQPSLGFNIELKFDDYIVYQQDHLERILQAVLQVVFQYAEDRPIIFSTFQPDAAQLVRKLQSIYPVFFLTQGGSEIYSDERRNSLEEAIKLCVEGNLQGIVSEVKGVFMNPEAVTKIKDSKLSLLTYGKLNNVPEAVYMQHLMGIEGVIVDLVQEITEAVSILIQPSAKGGIQEQGSLAKDEQVQGVMKPQFSQRELSFLLKLIPKLIQL